jgi:hypothetical protein
MFSQMDNAHFAQPDHTVLSDAIEIESKKFFLSSSAANLKIKFRIPTSILPPFPHKRCEIKMQAAIFKEESFLHFGF